jgi:uncharacterized protein YjbI with pentapeptide repeats
MPDLFPRRRSLLAWVLFAGMAVVPIAMSAPLPRGIPKPITRPLTGSPKPPSPSPQAAEISPLGVLADRDCPGCNLAAALLRYRYLPKANLAGAILQRSDLSFANLAGANLAGANLVGADLSFTDLTGANLTGANLSRAILTDTQLTGAILTQTNFADALMLHATIVLDPTLNLCRATLPDGQFSTQGCPPARGAAAIVRPASR